MKSAGQTWIQALHRTSSRVLSRVSRRTWRLIFRLLLVVVVTPILLQFLLAYVIAKDARLLPNELQHAKNLLIVTAHPDDECLFFAPSILGILGGNPDTVGGLLVLSTGNNYGLGEMRKQELRGSCEALGINEARCVALDHAELQDNPKVWWPEDVVEGIVKEYVKKWHIDAILTFDAGGVSGHINHRAVSAAISRYVSTEVQAPATFTLSSVFLLRKYSFLGDLPLTAFPFTWRILQALSFPSAVAGEGYAGRALVANSWARYRQTRAAFRQHDSQYSWDRNLYMILSRYVWFNDLQRVQKKDL